MLAYDPMHGVESQSGPLADRFRRKKWFDFDAIVETSAGLKTALRMRKRHTWGGVHRKLCPMTVK